MRGLMIGAAAFLALAVPSLASAETGGALKLTYASIDGGRSDQQCECDDNKDNIVALSGVVITDLPHEGWRLQFNGASADMDHNQHSDAFSQVEVHAVKDLGKVELGVFAGMFNHNGWNFNELGVEAAMNFEKGRIAVSAVTADSPNSNFDETTSVAATGTFNLNDSWSMGATVSSTDFGNFSNSQNNQEVDSYGINVAYHVPNSTLTVGLGYRSSESDHDVDFVGVTLAWGFGEGARGREMLGATALIADAAADE